MQAYTITSDLRLRQRQIIQLVWDMATQSLSHTYMTELLKVLQWLSRQPEASLSGGAWLGVGLARLRGFVEVTHLQYLANERERDNSELNVQTTQKNVCVCFFKHCIYKHTIKQGLTLQPEARSNSAMLSATMSMSCMHKQLSVLYNTLFICTSNYHCAISSFERRHK